MSYNAEDFNKRARQFLSEQSQTRSELEKCLESRQNDDINFICQKERAAYLLAIAQHFCKAEYDIGVRCQREAGTDWASKCFQENVRFGQCADQTLRRLYIYNLENNPKNPDNLG